MSVTSRSSTKTAKRRITQTTPHDTPGSLVFWCQRSPRNSTGVTPYEGAECRWGGQNRRLSTNNQLSRNIGVNSYWAQGLKPPHFYDHGARIYDEPPHFCDVILSKLCFKCLHWFYAILTVRPIIPCSARHFKKGAKFAGSVGHLMTKMLSAFRGASPP